MLIVAGKERSVERNKALSSISVCMCIIELTFYECFSAYSESIRGCPTCEVKCHYVYTQSPLEKVYELNLLVYFSLCVVIGQVPAC